MFAAIHHQHYADWFQPNWGWALFVAGLFVGMFIIRVTDRLKG